MVFFSFDLINFSSCFSFYCWKKSMAKEDEVIVSESVGENSHKLN
jgi:hypothetical protein